MSSTAYLACFEAHCQTRYGITEVLYNCPKCGGLLEARYDGVLPLAERMRVTFRQRRLSNAPLDQSGVWRYRELFPFLETYSQVVTLREGNTPLLDAPLAAEYGGLAKLTFKHQGFNPTGSFKDNGMVCGVRSGVALGHEACGLRVYRKHVGLHGRLRGGRRT